jgi:ACS family hexuronate transporter-like MFS transporter
LIGLGTSAGSVGGIIFPIACGLVLDRYPNGYTILFGICAAAYIVAFVIHHLLAPSFDPDSSFEGATLAE